MGAIRSELKKTGPASPGVPGFSRRVTTKSPVCPTGPKSHGNLLGLRIPIVMPPMWLEDSLPGFAEVLAALHVGQHPGVRGRMPHLHQGDQQMSGRTTMPAADAASSSVPHCLRFVTELPPSDGNTVVDRFSKIVNFMPVKKLPSAKGTAKQMVLSNACGIRQGTAVRLPLLGDVLRTDGGHCEPLVWVTPEHQWAV